VDATINWVEGWNYVQLLKQQIWHAGCDVHTTHADAQATHADAHAQEHDAHTGRYTKTGEHSGNYEIKIPRSDSFKTLPKW